MTIFVFLGPTLSVEAARPELDAVYLPPASQGDVYRAAREQPFAVGIIDGYFERMPAVWHKEILWALSQGVRVFGAASMGALRAAELARFGMKGVGTVFDDFHSGTLEDDDEVAVIHANHDMGYRALSEALVNIRATLAAAERRGVLTPEVCRQLVGLAKGTFYPERSYPNLLARATKTGIAEHQLEALRSFVASHRVDQKRADAFALLRTVRECRASGEPYTAPTFSLAHTEAWDQVVEWADCQPSIGAQQRTEPGNNTPNENLFPRIGGMVWEGSDLNDG